MDKKTLTFCLFITLSSVVINLKALTSTGIISGSNDTIIYSSYIDPADISIYPNPVINNTVTITAETDFNEIEILNIVGRIVYQKRFKPATAKATLNLQDLNKGIYVIRVNFDNNSLITEKIMIE